MTLMNLEDEMVVNSAWSKGELGPANYFSCNTNLHAPYNLDYEYACQNMELLLPNLKLYELWK